MWFDGDDFIELKEGENVTLRKSGGPNSALIIVENAEDYEEIHWFLGDIELKLIHGVSEDGDVFEVNFNPYFLYPKKYLITVVGMINSDDDIAYGTTFNLVVES